MWSGLRNSIFPRSRSLDDAARPTPNESQALAEPNLEQLVQTCNRYDVGNTFQGLQQYIQSLCQVIHLQREQIQRLEEQLCKGTPSAAPKAAVQRVVAAPVKDDYISVSMLGAVLGHERQILQYIQEQLLAQHVQVTETPNLTDAAVIIQIHRMKPRLPSDELAGVLHASAGCTGKLVVVFMHNLPSGHEKSMRPAGVNNTDPGRWQHFSQRCHKIVNMTFDETRWQWHDVNQTAAQGIIAAVTQLVKTHPDQTSPGSINVMASS